ncbi:MAG: aldehyde dehydrogenase family protein [Chloroflexi bacterium]|nr:aldehyde dehydrogenase family protein [Chloroflexota bacterium]
MQSLTIANEVDLLVARAHAAQRAFAARSEPKVDALLGDIAETFAAHAQELAIAAVTETGIGNVPDKTLKNRLASPVGVVFGLIPKTHPAATFVFKVLIALKARNALILSCHRDAQDVGRLVGELITNVLRTHNAPERLVQWVRRSRDGGRQVIEALMRHPGVGLILATGGSAMVRAAYASGNPAIGVGPGNAPTWVCADADIDRLAPMLITSKAFDNGIVCASEHNLVVDASIRGRLVSALERNGAAVLRPDEIAQFVEAVFETPAGHVRPNLVGQTASDLLAAAGLQREAAIRLVVVPAERAHLSGPLGREKLAPVTSLFTVSGDDDALRVAHALLANEGAGHTAIIHSHNRDRIQRFSREMPASRILVNVSGTFGTFGLETGLPLSMTLGTGTFGGTSTTDSVSYRHLLNVKRVAYRTREWLAA